MKVEFIDDRPVVDAVQIAPLMNIDVGFFQVLMQSGRIRSGVERGAGADAGKLV